MKLSVLVVGLAAALFAPAGTREASTAGPFVVPDIARIVAEIPDSFFFVNSHLSCLTRSELDGTNVNSRMVCYTALKPDPPPSPPPPPYGAGDHRVLSGTFSPGTGQIVIPIVDCVEFFAGIDT